MIKATGFETAIAVADELHERGQQMITTPTRGGVGPSATAHGRMKRIQTGDLLGDSLVVAPRRFF